MTEFTDKVEKQRVLMEAEEWGSGVKYIHANNGIIETAINNGNIHFKDNKNGRGWTVYAQEPDNLIDRFLRWKTTDNGKR